MALHPIKDIKNTFKPSYAPIKMSPKKKTFFQLVGAFFDFIFSNLGGVGHK